MPPLAALTTCPDWGAPLRDGTNATVEWLVVHLGDRFEAFSNALLSLLVAMEQVLRAAPPWLVIGLTAALAFAASRSVLLALGSAAGLWVIGALGQWEPAMQTVALVTVSVGLCIAIGLPLGVWCSRSAWARRIVLPVMDLMQTIPSFVYLLPAAMLFGLGKVPAILATVIYAVPPLVRLTDLGIREVGTDAVEAGRAFGATRWQLLTRVQIPLSMPSIMQGINQTTMMALAMVVVASMIGARGVGETVLVGLQRNDPGMGLVGGLVIVILAVVMDRMLLSYGRRLQAHRNAQA